MGSRVIGGMGAPEIVPFADVTKANSFVAQNGGQVMRLAEIPDAAVLAPVIIDRDSDDADFEERLRKLARASGG